MTKSKIIKIDGKYEYEAEQFPDHDDEDFKEMVADRLMQDREYLLDIMSVDTWTVPDVGGDEE